MLHPAKRGDTLPLIDPAEARKLSGRGGRRAGRTDVLVGLSRQPQGGQRPPPPPKPPQPPSSTQANPHIFVDPRPSVDHLHQPPILQDRESWSQNLQIGLPHRINHLQPISTARPASRGRSEYCRDCRQARRPARMLRVWPSLRNADEAERAVEFADRGRALFWVFVNEAKLRARDRPTRRGPYMARNLGSRWGPGPSHAQVEHSLFVVISAIA